MKPRIDTLGTVCVRSTAFPMAQRLPAQTKRFALLVYLAVDHPGLPVRRDRLLALLWPDLGDLEAHRALRQALYQLRRALGDEAIVSQGSSSIQLPTEAVDCDAQQLKRALGRHRSRVAVDLYRGDFLPGFHVPECPDFERWMEIEREAFRSQTAMAACGLAQRAAAANRVATGIHYARRAVEIGPYCELCWQCLIRLLVAFGDGAGASLTYARMCERFSEDLGLAPSRATTALLGQLGIAALQEPYGAPAG